VRTYRPSSSAALLTSAQRTTSVTVGLDAGVTAVVVGGR
jgi:hypothetical protein